MAPAAAAEQQPHVYVSLVKCLKTLEVDWDKFASEVGIKAKGNAQRKLNQALKKDGLQLSGGKIIACDADSPPAKKRKKDDSEEDGDTATPSKKKGAKGKAKNQQEDSDEIA